MTNYFLDNDLQVLKIALCSALTDSTKDEPMGVIRFWYWWDNDKKEIEKLSGVKTCGAVGRIYNEANQRIYKDTGYKPDYTYADLQAANKAMCSLSIESRFMINIHLKEMKAREKFKLANMSKRKYYATLNKAFDEFIELGGVRDLLYA